MTWPGCAELVTVTAMTHRGAVRTANEDALVVGGFTAAGVDLADPVVLTLALHDPVMVAVADGLGGHNAGEVAAALAVRRLAAAGHQILAPEQVAELLRTINGELYELAAADADCAGAGTTVAGLVLTATGTLWFNVGDSRVYRENDGYLGQVSVDDSPRPPNMEPGEPVPPTNIVIQTLGGAPAPTPVDPHIETEASVPLGRWLVCSDGLSDLVDIEEMERILAEAPDDAVAVKALWAAAMNASGRDNITILLIRRPAAC